jgi:hypothetical protein
MPSPISGSQQTLAIKKAIAWNTAVACGANSAVQFLTGQAKRSADVVVDESRGRAFSIDGTAGPVKGETSYTFNLRYAGMELLFAMFMGTAGNPAQQAATTAYLHTLKWNTDPYGLMVTIAKSMIAYIEEIPTAKVTGISISGEVGPNPLQVTIDVIGVNREVASTVNTLATFANVTLPSGGDANAVMFSHLVFRMNDVGAIALAAGDRIYPSKFTLALKRKMKGEANGMYRTTGANPQDLIDEPSNDGFPELKLTLEFPTHTGTTYLAALGNDSRKKLDITATGAQIAAPYNFTYLWQFPHLQLTNVNPSDGNGRITEPLEFLIHGAGAAPLGMTGITDPLWWSITSKLGTNPLA